jgi:hypothetical protein
MKKDRGTISRVPARCVLKRICAIPQFLAKFYGSWWVRWLDVQMKFLNRCIGKPGMKL